MKIIDRTAETASTFMTMNRRCIFSHCNRGARRNAGSINAIILHHTNFPSVDIARFNHIIANYVVLKDGKILKVREHNMALNSIGTNHRAVDIEFVGEYGSAAIRPSIPQLVAGRWLVMHLKSRYALSRIYGHAHFTNKPCPGPHIWYNIGLWAIRNGLRCENPRRAIAPGWSDNSLRLLPD